MKAGFSSTEVAALMTLGWRVEVAMMRASAAMLRANASEIRKFVPVSLIAVDFEEYADMLTKASDAPIEDDPARRLRLVT